MLLEGIFAAITTPFYADERVYYRKLEANIARYSRSLLAGMVVLGSTGEAPLIDDAEAREILRVAADAAAPEKVLIAGVGRESVKSTVDLAVVAAEFRYDALLVRPPSYFANQLSSAAVLYYYRSIADRSPLPVILYNIPQCVPYQIPIELVAELSAHPNIIAIKDSSGKVERIRDLVAATANVPRRTVPVTHVFEPVTTRMLAHPAEPEPSFVSVGELTGGGANAQVATATAAATQAQVIKTRNREVGFQVLCGSGSTVLDSLEAGATGAILGSAAFVPQACQEIYQAWKDHDQALAREKQNRLLDANRRIVAELGIAGIKYACDFNGYYGGRTRAPLLALTAKEKSEVEQLLAEIRN